MLDDSIRAKLDALPQSPGVYVFKDGDVRWRPAVDVNRIIMGAQLVAIVGLITLRTLMRKRRRWARP